MIKPITAVILAGGMGSRFGDISDVLPKTMIPFYNGEPVLYHNLMLCRKLGVKDVVLMLGHKSEVIEHYLSLYQEKYKTPHIYTLVETERLGTGGGINKLNFQGQPFYMMNGDSVYMFSIEKLQEEIQSSEALIACSEVKDTTSFGFVQLQGKKIRAFNEKPNKPTTGYVSTGFYFFNMDLSKYLPKKAAYFMLESELFPQLAKEGKLKAFKHAEWIPIDDTVRLETGRIKYAQALKNKKYTSLVEVN